MKINTLPTLFSLAVSVLPITQAWVISSIPAQPSLNGKFFQGDKAQLSLWLDKNSHCTLKALVTNATLFQAVFPVAYSCGMLIS